MTALTPAALLAVIQAAPALLAIFNEGDDTALVAALNDKTATASASAPLSVAGLLGALSAPSIATLWASPNAKAIRDDIVAQDRASVELWAQFAALAGAITSTECAAIVAMCTATAPIAASPAEVAFGFGVIVSEGDVWPARRLMLPVGGP